MGFPLVSTRVTLVGLSVVRLLLTAVSTVQFAAHMPLAIALKHPQLSRQCRWVFPRTNETISAVFLTACACSCASLRGSSGLSIPRRLVSASSRFGSAGAEFVFSRQL